MEWNQGKGRSRRLLAGTQACVADFHADFSFLSLGNLVWSPHLFLSWSHASSERKGDEKKKGGGDRKRRFNLAGSASARARIQSCPPPKSLKWLDAFREPRRRAKQPPRRPPCRHRRAGARDPSSLMRGHRPEARENRPGPSGNAPVEPVAVAFGLASRPRRQLAVASSSDAALCLYLTVTKNKNTNYRLI